MGRRASLASSAKCRYKTDLLELSRSSVRQPFRLVKTPGQISDFDLRLSFGLRLSAFGLPALARSIRAPNTPILRARAHSFTNL